ncbi:MAG TPA: hypothetical protein VGM94_17425 [Galbitalea sp.]
MSRAVRTGLVADPSGDGAFRGGSLCLAVAVGAAHAEGFADVAVAAVAVVEFVNWQFVRPPSYPQG